jgi:hypothetical protein
MQALRRSSSLGSLTEEYYDKTFDTNEPARISADALDQMAAERPRRC